MAIFSLSNHFPICYLYTKINILLNIITQPFFYITGIKTFSFIQTQIKLILKLIFLDNYRCLSSQINFYEKPRINEKNIKLVFTSVFRVKFFNQENLKSIPQMKNKKYNQRKHHQRKILIESGYFHLRPLQLSIFRFSEKLASYNFIMQIQPEQEGLENPFDIVYNARSSRASRSRKSSIHTLDKEKPRLKTKKLRKISLNPETFRFHQIREFEEYRNQLKPPRSEKGDKEQDVNIDDFLQLGGPIKTQSKKQQQLESGIAVGIASQRQLDSDFDLSGWQHNPNVDLEMHQ